VIRSESNISTFIIQPLFSLLRLDTLTDHRPACVDEMSARQSSQDGPRGFYCGCD